MADRLKSFIENSNLHPEAAESITRDFLATIEKELQLTQAKDLKILNTIIRELGNIKNRPEYEQIENLLLEMLNSTIKYANIVAEHWQFSTHLRFTQEEDREKYQSGLAAIDSRRRIVHNRVIDLINILSRNYKKLGLNNSWRADTQLYDPSPRSMRKRVGNWAVGIAAFLIKQGGKS